MNHKGFSGAGLNEVLTGAGVPKGSFYHYFPSKDAFGAALLEQYFVDYLAEMDELLGLTSTGAERLQRYFERWQDKQSADDFAAGCLAVKLGAEVADFSPAMRAQLEGGVRSIIDRLERMTAGGIADGSLPADLDPAGTAETLYEVWVGASVVAKVQRSGDPLDNAMAATRRLLGL